LQKNLAVVEMSEQLGFLLKVARRYSVF